MGRKTQTLKSLQGIVFILSMGHSGSTLLDMLLGSVNGLWTLGEIHYLQEAIAQGLRCGCGKPYDRCEFWRSVVQKVDLGDNEYPTNYFQLEMSKGFFLRLKWLASIITGRPYFIDRRALKIYAQSNTDLLTAIKATAKEQYGEDIHWFVDATKHGHRLFWLLQDPRFDMRIILLVKDPRAYVYSMVRKKQKISLLRVIRYSLIWSFGNLLFLRMLRLEDGKIRSSLIHYENLACQPALILEQLSKDLGIKVDRVTSDILRNHQNHAVGGNPIRLKTSETQIHLDEVWKTSLPKNYAKLIWFICMPVARRLGYSFA